MFEFEDNDGIISVYSENKLTVPFKNKVRLSFGNIAQDIDLSSTFEDISAFDAAFAVPVMNSPLQSGPSGTKPLSVVQACALGALSEEVPQDEAEEQINESVPVPSSIEHSSLSTGSAFASVLRTVLTTSLREGVQQDKADKQVLGTGTVRGTEVLVLVFKTIYGTCTGTGITFDILSLWKYLYRYR